MTHDPNLSDPFDFSYEPWVPPPEPEHCWFNTDDGVRLHYVRWKSEREDAPVILMIHGRRAHSRWFDPVIPTLHPQYDCVSIDLRSHGESETQGAIDLSRWAIDLTQFYALFEGRRRVVFAHSMAGRLAILMNEAHGIVPDALIMADTPLMRRPHHDHDEPKFKKKHYPDKDTILNRFRLMPPGTSANPELLRHVALHAIGQNDDGTWSWKFSEEGTSRPVRLQIPEFSEMKTEGFTCPTLIIHGEKSPLVTPDEAKMIAARFPNSSLAEIPDAYHHLMFDQPSLFSRAVLKFLESNGI